MDSYKKGQISVLDYLNAIAANIEVTQYIDGDLVIDYNEEAAVMIENQLSLCQKLKMSVHVLTLHLLIMSLCTVMY